MDILIPKEFPIDEVERSISSIKIATTSWDLAHVGLAEFALGLVNLQIGGKWDAQRLTGDFIGEYRDYATVLIGYYAANVGLNINSILSIQNQYARLNSKFSDYDPRDMDYPYLPKRNVFNTKLGYQLAGDR